MLNRLFQKFLFPVVAFFPALSPAQGIDYYRSPLDIPIHFSANFGEIRTNRFHTGIDIKTEGVTGKQLYAAADGYIARVTVAPGGYGRALYVAHPNGTTTVYAHLERFTPEVEEYLKAERYRRKQSDLDAFPDAARFPVRQGDLIGFTGNSGASSGPHLHFEVRQTSSARTLNVLTKGWVSPQQKDNVPPCIVRLYHIDVDTVAGVPIHSKARVYDVKVLENGNYSLVRTSPLKAGLASYFAIEATDRRIDVTNTFGIYRARLAVDGDEKLLFEKDGLLFTDVRYACASVLYDIQRTSRNEVVMLAAKRGNSLPMYKKAVNRGLLTFEKGVSADPQNHNVKITIEDDTGNASSLAFAVEYTPNDVSTPAPRRPEGRIATEKGDFMNYAEGLAISIPKGALYEPMLYTQSVVETAVKPRADSIRPLSLLHRLADGISPLHKAAKIVLAADIPEALRSKACLARVSDTGVLAYSGGSYENGSVSGSTRDFGVFCAVADTIPPTVKSSFSDGADLSSTSSITLTATDNFSGIANFTGTIDGRWIIFERVASRGQFIHRFDPENLQTGRTHTLEFTVRDGVGNRTVLRRTFYK